MRARALPDFCDAEVTLERSWETQGFLDQACSIHGVSPVGRSESSRANVGTENWHSGGRVHGPTGRNYSSDSEGDGPKEQAPNVRKATRHSGGRVHGPTGKRYSSDSEGDGPKTPTPRDGESKAEAIPGEAVKPSTLGMTQIPSFETRTEFAWCVLYALTRDPAGPIFI